MWCQSVTDIFASARFILLHCHSESFSPSLSLSLMICGWLSISVYTYTLRIRHYAGSAFACRREEVYFEHESYVIGRLMSGEVMPVGAKGIAVEPRVLTMRTKEFIH